MWDSSFFKDSNSDNNAQNTHEETLDLSAIAPMQNIHIDVGAQDHIPLNTASPLTGAEFTQNGNALQIDTNDGQSFTLHDYFNAPTPPSISGQDGTTLSGEIITPFIKNKNHNFAQDDNITSNATHNPAIGQITEISGDVTITRSNGATLTAEKGTTIFQGDIIETAETGAVNIMFADESSFAISNDARMTIDEFIFDPSTMDGLSNFSMLQGVFVYTSGEIGGKDPDDVKIETPIGSIGIRGTIIAGEIQQDGASKITVVEGAIYVRNGSGEQILSQQFETVEIHGGDNNIQNIGTLSPNQVLENTHGVRGVAGIFTNNLEQMGSDGSDGNDPTLEQNTQPHQQGEEQIKEAPPPGDKPLLQGDETAPLPPQPTAPPPPTLLDEQQHDGLLNNEPSREFKLTANRINPDSNTDAIQKAPSPPPNSTLTTKDPLPPPDVINGNGTKPAVAGSSRINLNNADDFANVHVISGLPNGAQYGAAITTVYNASNGFNDLILMRGSFANGNTPGNFVAISGTANLSANYDLSGASYRNFSDPNAANTSAEQVTSVTSGDFDGDGTHELFIGAAYGYTPNTAENDGFTYVMDINGNTSTLYNNYSGQVSVDSLQDLLGYSVDNLGDINNDGHTDIALSSPGYSSGHGLVRLELVDTDLGTIDTSITYEGAAGEYIGGEVTALGDINGDGYDDFAFGVFDGMIDGSNVSSSLNAFFIVEGGENPLIYDELLEANKITGGTDFGRHVDGVGDINGDGFSDVLVSNGDTSLKLLMGQSTISNGNHSSFTNQFTIDVSASSYKIEGAASIDDFNADGHDDFIVMMRDGADIKMSIIMGSPSLSGLTVDLEYLKTHPGMNLLIDYTLDSVPASKYHMEFTGGDMDGDGFDDVIIADAQNDTAFIINGGRYGAADTTYQKGNNVTANADHQKLTGTALNDTFMQNGHTGLVAHGGAGQDSFIIDNAMTGANANFHQIDGGGGDNDKFILDGGQGSIDLSTLNSNHIQHIEAIEVGSGNDLTLSVKQIFDVLKSSDNGELKITALGAGQTLTIKSASDFTDDLNGIADAIETLTPVTGIAATADNGYQRFDIGNYKLYIDDDFGNLVTQTI
ncbi:MAG: FecR domain-containing protein [Alphaproteobacteria bacterium]